MKFHQHAAILSALALLTASVCAHADIRTTKHGQFRSSYLPDKPVAATPTIGNSSEICVFCHTPTSSGTPRQDSPIWQPLTPPMHSYVLYDDIGRKQFGDKPTVGSQSVACLSCHDAAQAFLATNLAFDHPFGVPYRGFQKEAGINKPLQPDDKTNGANNSGPPKSSAKQLKWVDDFRTPARGTVDNRTVWWVQSSGEGLQRTSNDLPLYARPEAGVGEEIPQEIPYIECTSCHNPHSSNPLFLRVNNAGSRLCLTCHDK